MSRQWHNRSQLAAYSCGGSHGIDAKGAAPRSHFHHPRDFTRMEPSPRHKHTIDDNKSMPKNCHTRGAPVRSSFEQDHFSAEVIGTWIVQTTPDGSKASFARSSRNKLCSIKREPKLRRMGAFTAGPPPAPSKARSTMVAGSYWPLSHD